MGSVRTITGSGWNGGGRGTVTVMVCTIPKRTAMLRECLDSIAKQTFLEMETLVLCDDLYEGQSVTINRIAAQARGEWLLPFDDDDLMLPEFIEKLIAASDGFDVVYAPPWVKGEGESGFHGEPPAIPTPALVRAELWFRCGGYDEKLTQQEDRGLWDRALSLHAKFKRVDERLWTYRFHGENKSRHGGVA